MMARLSRYVSMFRKTAEDIAQSRRKTYENLKDDMWSRPMENLGTGAHGSVFGAIIDGKKRAVKMTTRRKEKEAYEKIREVKRSIPEKYGKNLPDIFDIQTKKSSTGPEYYMIVMEVLMPMHAAMSFENWPHYGTERLRQQEHNARHAKSKIKALLADKARFRNLLLAYFRQNIKFVKFDEHELRSIVVGVFKDKATRELLKDYVDKREKDLSDTGYMKGYFDVSGYVRDLMQSLIAAGTVDKLHDRLFEDVLQGFLRSWWMIILKDNGSLKTILKTKLCWKQRNTKIPG